MSKSLIELAGSVTSDALALFGVSGAPTATLQHVLGQHVARRVDIARKTLLDEVRRGEVDTLVAASQDDAIDIIYRYCLAARDNAARLNLRLLAKVIVGQAKRNRLYADEFNKYAEMLSRLTRDEVFVIGRLHHYRKAEEKRQGPTVGTGQYWPKFIKEVVPSEFHTEEYVLAICCGGLRSGLMYTPPDWDSSGTFTTSPIMDEVSELVDFQEALAAEAADSDERPQQ